MYKNTFMFSLYSFRLLISFCFRVLRERNLSKTQLMCAWVPQLEMLFQHSDEIRALSLTVNKNVHQTNLKIFREARETFLEKGTKPEDTVKGILNTWYMARNL